MNKAINKISENVKEKADFLKIISEENRLRIIYLIRSGKRCVCDIEKKLKLPQNLVSHHLKVLKNFQILSSKRKGVKIFYQLNQKVLEKYLKEVSKYLGLYFKCPKKTEE
ncbi:MAG: winged helix-turn-helix transcriptional regulator [Deltaproteobacteria bacterium]|nr:winged helix-turn-helix transcriptional regulator [Deltaproteobacteria bacterium]